MCDEGRVVSLRSAMCDVRHAMGGAFERPSTSVLQIVVMNSGGNTSAGYSKLRLCMQSKGWCRASQERLWSSARPGRSSIGIRSKSRSHGFWLTPPRATFPKNVNSGEESR